MTALVRQPTIVKIKNKKKRVAYLAFLDIIGTYVMIISHLGRVASFINA